MRIFLLFFSLLFSLNSYALKDSEFVKLVEKQDWQKKHLIKDSTQISLYTWLKLVSEKRSDFKELATFIKFHPSWPKIEQLKQRIEDEKIENYSPQELGAWFKQYPPLSFNGKKLYISLIKDPMIIKQYVKQLWLEDSFSTQEEGLFLSKYGKFLSSSDHLKRINFMLYSHNIVEAKRMLRLIPKDVKNIYNIRLKMLENNSSVIELKEHHLKDIGILHNVAHIHDCNNDEESLLETLLKVTHLDNNSLQKYFWRYKLKLIRGLIAKKQYDIAYKFAISHGHSTIKEVSEAEWLAGWISLRFLKEPEKAIIHFKNFYSKVKMPISLSRGAYWLGRSYEQLKDFKQSNTWYNIAAKYYTSFYGQLALCKISKCELKIPEEPKITAEDQKKYNNNQLVKAAKILENSSIYNHYMKDFLFKAINLSKSPGEISLIAKTNFKNVNYNLYTELAKQASYKNVIVMERSYPIPKYVFSKHKIDHALVLSLIRQESVFNHQAISSAGAMGLMQMMPFVAERTAKVLGVKYNKNKMLSDPHFNSRLGSAHVKELLLEYNNSYILAIAAYNAGSKAVNKWIEDNGDPRLMKNDEEVIDWLEKITFYETRNYVQRVLENRAIYYVLMNKKSKILEVLRP